MIRVKLEMDPAYRDRAVPLEREARAFRDCGITVGTDLKNPDISIVHDCLIAENEKAGRPPRTDPIIVFERQASATLNTSSFQRKLIERPNVLGWIKEHTLRDVSLHNAEMYKGRYHLHYMNLDSIDVKLKRPIVASQRALDKIFTAIPHYLNPIFDEIRLRKGHPIGQRRIDVMYSGMVKYDFEPIELHRLLCCATIQSLKLDRSIIGMGRVFRASTFGELLRDTKIFVSPYGWGEYSWKDYEAIYSGCILVKPTCNFVQSFGFDVFREGLHCLECAPDFSDLPSIVDNILSDINRYEAFALEAQASIIRAADKRNWVPQSASEIKKKL